MSSLTLPQNSAPAYHWTGPNQRRFLETLAQTGVVRVAAKAVAMSAQAAYEFRTRAAGRVFALGWLAAILLSRDRLVDDLMERAFMGQEDEMVRDPDNNRLVRKRTDNRLGMGMLGRLDRMVEAVSGTGAGQGDAFAQSARLVAGDFERFLDLVEREGGGSEAGLFLATHAEPQTCAFHYQLPQSSGDFVEDHDAKDAGKQALLADATSPEGRAADLSVWWDDTVEDWRTDFPPPQDYDGEEQGSYGDDSYERTLTEAEAAVQNARQCVENQPYIDAAYTARAAFFAPDAKVKAEIRRREAEKKAELKTAAKAQASLARLAEKRRLSDAKLARERAVREMQECPVLVEDDLEMKAADVPNGAAPDDSAVAAAPQKKPRHRSIIMPQKPRPLFGIYGDKLPGRDSVW